MRKLIITLLILPCLGAQNTYVSSADPVINALQSLKNTDGSTFYASLLYCVQTPGCQIQAVTWTCSLPALWKANTIYPVKSLVSDPAGNVYKAESVITGGLNGLSGPKMPTFKAVSHGITIEGNISWAFQYSGKSTKCGPGTAAAISPPSPTAALQAIVLQLNSEYQQALALVRFLNEQVADGADTAGNFAGLLPAAQARVTALQTTVNAASQVAYPQ